MLPNASKCFKMHQNASKCFKNASKCFKMLQNALKMLQNASKLLQNASKCFKNASKYFKMLQNCFKIASNLLQKCFNIASNFLKHVLNVASKWLQNCFNILQSASEFFNKNTIGPKVLSESSQNRSVSRKYVQEPKNPFMQPTRLSKHIQKVCADCPYHNTAQHKTTQHSLMHLFIRSWTNSSIRS